MIDFETQEREALYEVCMGLRQLQDLPEHLRTQNISIAACTIDPSQYMYVPVEYRKFFPRQLSEKCALEMRKRNYDMDVVYNPVPKTPVPVPPVEENHGSSVRPYKARRDKRDRRDANGNGIPDDVEIRESKRADERYYRDVTGDYDHDGDVDRQDKKLERNGYGYIDI